MSTTTDDLDLDADVEEDLDEEFVPDEEPGAAPEAPVTRRTMPTPHVPGGIPAAPLTVITANTTVAAVSAAVVAAGAVPTGLAAAGLVATAAGAGALKRRSAARKAAAAGKTEAGGGKSGAATGRTGTASGGSARIRPTGGGAGRSRGGGNSRTGAAAAGKSGARAMRAAGQAAKQSGGRGKQPGKGMLGAVKAARDDRKAGAPTRAQQRAKDTADSRRLADARRAAKAARKAEKKAAKGKGPKGAGASGGKSLNLRKSPKPGEAGGRGQQAKDIKGKKAGGKDGAGQLSMRERARQAKRRVREAARRARDERTRLRLGRMKALRKRARARARMWRRLTASALRCYARKAVAVGISLPFFAIGLVTHPLGVWLGWKWLQYPGPRIYRRLAAAADRARRARDSRIRDEYDAAVEAAADDQDDEPIAATVRRAPRNHNAHSGASTGGSTRMSTAGPGFLFNESAADMESAAQGYDPDGMMHVHDTIQGFPAALESVANTFAILAQKSDEEMPLEPEVGEALDAIYKALQHAIDEAEEAFKTFRMVHEQDIKRHEEPRNNAEEGWDTTNN